MVRRVSSCWLAVGAWSMACVVGSPLQAQQLVAIDKDTVVSTIQDESGTTVGLSIPESLRNDQCERRIYGTPAGIGGMFRTLYSADRRTESYEAAIRELSMQPQSSETYLDQLKGSLEAAGVAVDDAQFVLDMVEHGANAINKKYVAGGTLAADAKNRLARIGRQLNAAQKNPRFAEACLALEGIKATTQLADTVVGAVLLNSLSTDQAWRRLEGIERAIESQRKAEGSIDPALVRAVERSKTNLLAAQSMIGAFAVSVNDRLPEITDSALSLGAALGETAAKLSAPAAMWIGAPLMTYNTLRGISDQWELAQDGVTLATVTKVVENYGQDNSVSRSVVSYGRYAFYAQMEETFSVGGAKLKDLLSPGHVNKDWAEYYKAEKGRAAIGVGKSTSKSEARAGQLPKYLRTGSGGGSGPSSSASGAAPKSTVSASYKPMTRQGASAIVKTFGSIPGGITLEGEGKGIDGITSAEFNKTGGVIVLNGAREYEIPVAPAEMKEIFLAIAKDERIGVSLVSDYVSYGALPKDGDMSLMMRQTDWFLAHLAYGWKRQYSDYKIARADTLKERDDTAGNVMCYFRFCDYEFALRGTQYELIASQFVTTLIPIQVGGHADDGGGLPDFEVIDNQKYPSNLLYNIKHIADNAEYYMRERMMRMVNCYGEAAAFARALKRNGIDLKKLAASM